MKWNNKNKTVRRKTWYAVHAPKREDIKDAVKWCREYPSDGNFYNHYTNTRWWFEKENDAIMFALRWS